MALHPVMQLPAFSVLSRGSRTNKLRVLALISRMLKKHLGSLQIEGEQINSPIPGSFANGTGQFEFRLDRLHGNNHVPDAGSTLAMLGMALCTLGGIARRVEALTPQAGIGRKQRCLRQTALLVASATRAFKRAFSPPQ
jgi:VPDSG-CTERM motif